MSKHLAGNRSLPGRAGQFLCAIILLVPSFVAAQTRPLFNLQSTTQSPFPSDRFTVNDPRQDTGLRVNLPTPNCATNPSDCADVALLNQLDGFDLQARISIPFDGAIDPATVSSKNGFLVQLPAPLQTRPRPGRRCACGLQTQHHRHQPDYLGPGVEHACLRNPISTWTSTQTIYWW